MSLERITHKKKSLHTFDEEPFFINCKNPCRFRNTISMFILYTIYTHVMVCMSMQLMQSNYNVDSNTKSSNYKKIQLKGLIYFELKQTSN